MTAIIIILIAICLILARLLYKEDNKNSKLAAENSLLKSRAEVKSKEPGPLNTDEIMDAIRHAGFVPDPLEGWIRFMVQGERFYIQTDRLPRVFVSRHYTIDPKEWEMDYIRHAAHLMSDEYVMVKALIDDKPQENGLYDMRFLVASEDRNYPSLRDNLMDYIHLIEDGRIKMSEIYDNLMQKKREAAIGAHPFMPADQTENKVLS